MKRHRHAILRHIAWKDSWICVRILRICVNIWFLFVMAWSISVNIPTRHNFVVFFRELVVSPFHPKMLRLYFEGGYCSAFLWNNCLMCEVWWNICRFIDDSHHLFFIWLQCSLCLLLFLKAFSVDTFQKSALDFFHADDEVSDWIVYRLNISNAALFIRISINA